MLIFYEKKGRKIYIVFIIAMILFITSIAFVSEYIVIHNNINEIRQAEMASQTK